MSALSDLVKYSMTGDVLYHGERFIRAKEATEQLAKLQSDLTHALADRDKANTEIQNLHMLMPCGHLARYAVNEKEGTQYCMACEFEATKKELGVLRRLASKLIEDES